MEMYISDFGSTRDHTKSGSVVAAGGGSVNEQIRGNALTNQRADAIQRQDQRNVIAAANAEAHRCAKSRTIHDGSHSSR